MEANKRILAGDIAGKKYQYETSLFHNANGAFIEKVTVKKIPDTSFFNLVSWSGIQEKKKSGIISPLIYLDGQIQEFIKIGKPDHKDVKELLLMWDQLVKNEKLPIKYRPGKPVPGMITPAEMAKYLKNASTYKKSTSTDLSNYLKAEITKAEESGDVDLYNELGYWLEYASGFKHEKKNVLKKIVKTVLTGGLGTKEGRAVLSGGLSEKKGREVISTISTGGLAKTKAGKKVSAKIEKVAEKVDKVAEKIDTKSDELADKAIRGFKVLNLAPVRLAFLSFAAINGFGIASHLQKTKDAGDKGDSSSKDKWKKLKDFWYKMGGSRSKFEKAIKNGSKKKPFLAKAEKKKSADGSIEQVYLFKRPDHEGFYNVVQVAAVAAWIGVASSVIAVVKQIAGKPPEMDDESAAVIDANAAAEQALFEQSLANESNSNVPEFLRDLTADDGGFPFWGKVAIGAGIIGGAYLVISKIRS